MNYRVPGSDIVIEKGTAIYISITAIHNDEQYFPEPQKYDPDRFKENFKGEELIYFPFGYGQRACIGNNIQNLKNINFSAVLQFQLII